MNLFERKSHRLMAVAFFYEILPNRRIHFLWMAIRENTDGRAMAVVGFECPETLQPAG